MFRLLVVIATLVVFMPPLVVAKGFGLDLCARMASKEEKLFCFAVAVRVSGYPFRFYDFFTNEEARRKAEQNGLIWRVDEWIIMTLPNPPTLRHGKVASSNIYRRNKETTAVSFQCAEHYAMLTIGSRDVLKRDKDGKASFRTWFDDDGPIENTWPLEPGGKGVRYTAKDFGPISEYLKRLLSATKVKFEFDVLDRGKVRDELVVGAMPLAVFPVFVECPVPN